jgi:hypothetical protein
MPAGKTPCVAHAVVEALPPLIRHGADAKPLRVAGQDDAPLVHHADRVGDLGVRHLGVVALDQGVRRLDPWPVMYCDQPSMVALTKRCTTSRRSSTMRWEMSMVVW